MRHDILLTKYTAEICEQGNITKIKSDIGQEIGVVRQVLNKPQD